MFWWDTKVCIEKKTVSLRALGWSLLFETPKRAGRRLISKLCIPWTALQHVKVNLLLWLQNHPDERYLSIVISAHSKKLWFHRLRGLVLVQLSSSEECWHVLWRWIGIIARGWFRFSTAFMAGDPDIRLLWRCYRFIAGGFCHRSTDFDVWTWHALPGGQTNDSVQKVQILKYAFPGGKTYDSLSNNQSKAWITIFYLV